MPDVVFVVVTLAFFALCALYIRGCERIISGGDEAPDAAVDEADESDESGVGVAR